MRQLMWAGLAFGAMGLAALAACSGDDTSSLGGGAAGTGAGSGTGGSGNSSATGGDLGFGGSISTGGGTSQGGGATCAGESTSAQPVPLDMYIMLDRSGSMNEDTGVANVTKWDAVTSGLGAFFAAPESAGLGVAMQFFPLNKPGVPDSCTTHAQCGTSGPCLISVCEAEWAIFGNIVPCASNSDCGAFGPCVDLGECANDTNYICRPVGGTCSGNLGACVDLVTSVCSDALSCDAGDYATAAVAMGTLPGNATALDTEIGLQTPSGGTPTSSALQGTVNFAVAHKQANPLHEVVAVLATDGIPTLCDPTDADDIAQIAATAFNGTPSVPTFVIGVISPNDPGAQATLNQIAAAGGGTTSAFIVDPNGNVTQAFLDALNQIRGNSLACEYFIPQPTPPDTIDFGLVNVDHTPPGSTTANTLPYVGDEGSCDPTTGGWYYDTDPAVSDPTKIMMCPATCDLLQGGGDLSIRVGCETVVPR